MIWLLVLPFRLAFALFKIAVFFLLLPIFAIVSLIALFVVGFALFVPLLPLAALVFIVWAVSKMASRPRLAA